MTHHDHTQTLRAATDGDEDALAALVRAYHDRVYRFGVAVCHNRFDADDAVQEAFIKLARRPDVAQQAPSSVLGWLLAVVRTTCAKLMRPFARERRALGARIEIGDAEELGDPMDPQRASERFELVRAVQAAIAALPPAYREVIILRDLEGLSGEETSTMLDVELSTVKTRLHRGRAMLREVLATTTQELP